MDISLLTPTPNQRSGPARRKVGRWVLFVIIVPVPIKAIVRRISLYTTAVSTINWRSDGVFVRLAVSGGMVVVSVVLAALCSREPASLLQDRAVTGIGLGWKQPRSRSFGCPSSGGLIDQFVDSNFPLTKLLFIPTTQGEKLQIVVTAPPHCERVLSW